MPSSAIVQQAQLKHAVAYHYRNVSALLSAKRISMSKTCYMAGVLWDSLFHHETQFSSQLHVAHYPYVALLSGSNERTKKVASSEGLATPSDIMQMLQPAVGEHGAQFVADQADHNERVSASFLSPFKASMLPLPVCSTHPTRKCCVFNWP